MGVSVIGFDWGNSIVSVFCLHQKGDLYNLSLIIFKVTVEVGWVSGVVLNNDLTVWFFVAYIIKA